MANKLNTLRDALDAAYPIPDTPHESVKQRARESRTAFIQGWQSCVASTALQAPVREVLEVIGAIANAPVMEPIPVGISFSEQHCNFYRADTGQGMGNEFYDKWRDRADEFPDRITARVAIKAAPLPAAPVQKGGE